MSDWWVILALFALAALSRIFTTNSLAGEPTSDEYMFGVHARDLARTWAAGGEFSLGTLGGEGRSIAVEAAALSFLLPWDHVTLGRTIQALFNALGIPLTFVLGRQIGLARSAAAAAALLLLAVPEFQESAWRFWTDSQATFLCLAYLAALAALAHRLSVRAACAALGSLALLFLTKDSAAVTVAPFLPTMLALWVGRRLRTRRARVGVVALLGLAGLATAVLATGDSPLIEELTRVRIIGRLFAALPLLVSTLREAILKIPEYIGRVGALLGPAELGLAFLWAWAAGLVWLLLQVGWWWTGGRRATGPAAGWLLAAVAWAPALLLPMRGLGSLGGPEPWQALGIATALMAAGMRAFRGDDARGPAWGYALLGLVVLAFLAQRLAVWVVPRLGVGAAFTVRSFFPILPLCALLAGGALWAAASSGRALLGWPPFATAVATSVATLLLVGVWSPLLRERVSAQPLLGRVADRGADPDKAEGMRVQVLVEAEGWLTANVRPTDVVITGLPRQLAWYTDLDVKAMERLIDLGAQPRSQQERRAYIADRVGPTGADYVVDFNRDWTQPASEEAREWRQSYEWLSTRPNLEVVYLRRDKYGHPVFFVVRNHGYATSYGYRDREQARGEQLTRRGQ